MKQREILIPCTHCGEAILIGEEHVGIITCRARCSERVVDVEDAVQFKSFCAICATDMDFRFLFPEPRRQSAEHLKAVILGRESHELPEDYTGIGHCEVCLHWIAEGEPFRTIEAERTVIGPECAEVQESLTFRCYCESCSDLFDFEATEIYRRGHDPNGNPNPTFTPASGFMVRSDEIPWQPRKEHKSSD